MNEVFGLEALFQINAVKIHISLFQCNCMGVYNYKVTDVQGLYDNV